jgi:hypothetical protein
VISLDALLGRQRRPGDPELIGFEIGRVDVEPCRSASCLTTSAQGTKQQGYREPKARPDCSSDE